MRPKHTGRVARTASSHYLPRAGMVLVLAAEAELSRLAMRCRSATVSCWIRSSFCWYIVSSRARYLPRRAPLVRPGARPASACACHTGIPARSPRRLHPSRYCCAGPVHARPTYDWHTASTHTRYTIRSQLSTGRRSARVEYLPQHPRNDDRQDDVAADRCDARRYRPAPPYRLYDRR